MPTSLAQYSNNLKVRTNTFWLCARHSGTKLGDYGVFPLELRPPYSRACNETSYGPLKNTFGVSPPGILHFVNREGRPTFPQAMSASSPERGELRLSPTRSQRHGDHCTHDHPEGSQDPSLSLQKLVYKIRPL